MDGKEVKEREWRKTSCREREKMEACKERSKLGDRKGNKDQKQPKKWHRHPIRCRIGLPVLTSD